MHDIANFNYHTCTMYALQYVKADRILDQNKKICIYVIRPCNFILWSFIKLICIIQTVCPSSTKQAMDQYSMKANLIFILSILNIIIHVNAYDSTLIINFDLNTVYTVQVSGHFIQRTFHTKTISYTRDHFVQKHRSHFVQGFCL